MSQTDKVLEALALLPPNLRDFGQRLAALVMDVTENQDVTYETLGSALVGMGTGLLTSSGYTTDHVRLVVEAVLGVMPESQVAPPPN